MANGLCISGSAIGSIILPPVLRWLLETYGYRGSCLIMGGITLNVLVGALFYEPVEQHMIRVPRARQALEDIPEEEDVGIVMKFENVDETAPNQEPASEKQLMPFNSPPSPLYLPDDADDKQQFVRSASAAVVQSYAKPGDEFQPRARKISTPVRLPQRNQTFTPGQLNSQTSLYAVPEGRSSSNKLAMRNSSRNRLSKRSPSTSSFLYISTPYHGSTLSFQPKEFSSHLSLRSAGSGAGESTPQEAGGADETGQGKAQQSQRSKFFDLSLLKDPMYLVILISNSTNAISYTNFIILLPAFGLARNFDKSLSAYLLSVVSATDLIGRIGGSALSDMGFIPKTWYFVGGLSISGVSLALLPLAYSYGAVCFWCSIFGLASGIYVGITAVIMADMLGTERLTSSYGISLFVNGILQLVGPPLCNWWTEAVNNYNPLFHTLGLTLLAGSALWAFMPWIQRRKAKEEEKLEAQLDEEAIDGY